MIRPPPRSAIATAVAILLAVAACGDDAPARRRPDSVVATAPAVRPDSAPPVTVVEEVTWDEASAGPALFVPDDTALSTAAAAVLPHIGADAPDSALVSAGTRLAGVSVDLFAPRGKVGTATVAAANASDPSEAECAPWPPVRLAATPAGNWRVAFSSGHAVAIPTDSLEGLTAADSAARAAQVARLASLVPGTNKGQFAGLPFSVRQARRFSPSPALDVLVAEVVRKIAQEANPREQHVLIVAEREPSKGGNHTLVYHETSSGGETSVETRDVLAAVGLGDERRPTLVLTREYEDALAYSLLQRVGPREWRVRWTSAKLGCEEEET